MSKYFYLPFILCFYISTGHTQTRKNNSKPPPALSSITITDLKRDLYGLADDRFRGRSAGTLDELKAAVWWADKLKAAGLKPAGEDGTYFQFFTLWRNRVAPNSTIAIGDRTLQVWKDVLLGQIAPATVNAPLLYLGKANSAGVATADVRGKAVVLDVVPDSINLDVSIPEWRYHRAVMARYGNALLSRGAAAIIFINDDFAEHSWDYARENLSRGLYDIEGGVNATVTTKAPVIWVRQSAADGLKAQGAILKANIAVESFEYPSVNVIGAVAGTDPVLSKEYVLFSGHGDAHGIRNAYSGDTIYNGADDNGSVNVAMLAIARAFKKVPGRRSALFVFHGAEERGLLGSRHFTTHATVPLASIVAVLNGDMIGRNNPDSAALLGALAPHKNSIDLVQMALDANRDGPRFKLDTAWDKTTHVEGWYFRSDHLPYARLGIPALMYTTLLHADYHTPQDDAENIDYTKLKRMADWMYATAWKVANADRRPDKLPGFKLER
ncbi:MAG TPA: M28 family peptidase [Flavisolibacter sp.]|nr:M28 family peptidase [Flavisolibacter sp.]